MYRIESYKDLYLESLVVLNNRFSLEEGVIPCFRSMEEKEIYKMDLHQKLSSNYLSVLMSVKSIPFGYISYCFQDDSVLIKQIYVMKSYRGRGVSRKLSEGVIKEASLKRKKKIITKVRSSNTPMIKSNQTLGFVPEGLIKSKGYTTFVKRL